MSYFKYLTKNRIFWPVVVLSLGVTIFATTLAGVVFHFSPVPYGDQWDGTLGFYMDALADPWTAFFGLHNEHRLFFSRLIFFADMRYLGGRNVLDLAANVVLATLIAIALYRITSRNLTHSRASRMIGVGGVLAFAFAWMQAENFTWGFQNQWFAVYLFGLCAFDALELSESARFRGASASSAGWFALAICSTIMAALSMVSGVLVAPVLGVQAAYLRTPRMRLVVIALATVAIWLTYFTGWHSNSPSGGLRDAVVHHPLGVLLYALLYLGSPAIWGCLGMVISALWGAVVLVSFIYALWIARQRRAIIGSALLAMAVFISASAFVTAAGRIGFGVDTATLSRYTTAPLLMTASLLAFLWLNETRPELRRWLVGGFVFVLVMIAIAQRMVFHSTQRELYAKRVAGLAVRANVYDAPYTAMIYPNPAALEAVAKRAQAAGLSIFAPDQRDYAVPPEAVSASAQCIGKIDSISATATPDRFAATGWLYDPADKQYVSSIVIADRFGKVLGTGITGAQRPDLAPVTGSKDRYGGWTGFFKRPTDPEIRLFGRLDTGRYCEIPDAQSFDTGNVQPPA
ncbi:hypothetical protein [Paraburkholderia flagellata]|uniref:hypothetical protein n=1 Tax=Paraburkholderia flagellata TaxID=2883241 RepID=UPI001F3B3C12|nr:hypothetical protein [Paraburkholderia flagellata]